MPTYFLIICTIIAVIALIKLIISIYVNHINNKAIINTSNNNGVSTDDCVDNKSVTNVKPENMTIALEALSDVMLSKQKSICSLRKLSKYWMN